MPHLFLKILVPAAALATFVVGTTIAWSNNVILKGDLATRKPVTQTVAAIPNFDNAFASRTRKADREIVSHAAIKVDFTQAFADATATPRRHNTPGNREKLRNAGWARVVGSPDRGQ